MATHLEVRRDHPAVVRIVDAPEEPLASGQVRVAVQRIALTANNITYAVMGDVLDYWSFFPAEDGWGRLPAMGFGEVVASAADEIALGTRLYGWFPLADSVVIEPQATPSGSWVDDAAHRVNHAPVYRMYIPTDLDQMYIPDQEDLVALLRGLYLTSWLVDAKLTAEHPDLATVVVTSASSKTALALAHRRREAGRGGMTIAITSPANLGAVTARGCYDEVLTYADARGVESDGPAAIVDFAGRAETVRRLHAGLGDSLVASVSVGLTHGAIETQDDDLPGPAPEFFFAPTEVKRQVGSLGGAGYAAMLADDLRGFVGWASGWLQIERADTAQAAEAAYHRVRKGEVRADHGVVLRPDRW